jgi:hypothetical protein
MVKGKGHPLSKKYLLGLEKHFGFNLTKFESSDFNAETKSGAHKDEIVMDLLSDNKKSDSASENRGNLENSIIDDIFDALDKNNFDKAFKIFIDSN